MAKTKKASDASQVETLDGDLFWIYPGERRPVVVQAKNERHAKHKVTESPEYDGFPVYVFSVEKFAGRCLPKNGGTKLELTSEEKKLEEVKKKFKELFFLTEVTGGITERVSVFTELKPACWKVDELTTKVSFSARDIRVFRMNMDTVEGAASPVELDDVYSATLAALKVEEKK